MVTRFEIEQRIQDNFRKRKLTPNIDKLEFLVPVKFSDDFLDLHSYKRLRNARAQKWYYLVISILHAPVIYQLMLHLNWTSIGIWSNLVLVSFTCIWFLWMFIESKIVLMIAPEGLTIYPNTFIFLEQY